MLNKISDQNPFAPLKNVKVKTFSQLATAYNLILYIKKTDSSTSSVVSYKFILKITSVLLCVKFSQFSLLYYNNNKDNHTHLFKNKYKIFAVI